MNEEKVIDFLLAYTKGIDLMNCAAFAIDNNFQEPEDYGDYGCRIKFLSQEQCSVQNSEDLGKWHQLHHKANVSEDAGSAGSFSYAFPPAFNFIDGDDVGVELVSDELAEAEISTGNGTFKYSVVPSENHDSGLVITSGELVLKWGAGTVNLFEG